MYMSKRSHKGVTGMKTFNIPVEAALEVIGGKWKVVILCHLIDHGTLRTSELKKRMPNITQKMLTQQLRELESDGVLERIVYNQVPPKVEYKLTDYGTSLAPALQMLCSWGEQHIEKVVSEGEDVMVLSGAEE